MTTITLEVSAGPLSINFPDGMAMSSAVTEDGHIITIQTPGRAAAAKSVAVTPPLNASNPLSAEWAAVHHKVPHVVPPVEPEPEAE